MAMPMPMFNSWLFFIFLYFIGVLFLQKGCKIFYNILKRLYLRFVTGFNSFSHFPVIHVQHYQKKCKYAN